MKLQRQVVLPADLKIQNRKKILDFVRTQELCSISDISQELGISRQTVTKAIQFFKDKNLIFTSGKGESTDIGGKKPELFYLNVQRYFICISTSDRKMRFSLLPYKNVCIDMLEIKYTFEETFDETIELICNSVKTILNRNQLCPEKVYGISLGVGGIVDRKQDIVLYNTNNIHWNNNISVVKALEDRLGDQYVYIIDNVSKMASQGLLCCESYMDKKLVAIYCDKGIGGCCINHGKTIYGEHCLLGEIGHIVVDASDQAQCKCGGYGCFEVMVSESRVFQYIDQELSVEAKEHLTVNEDSDIRVELMRDAENGNIAAQHVVDRIAHYFAAAIQTIYCGFDPEYVIIEGVYAQNSDYLKKKISEYLSPVKFLPHNRDLKIECCKEEIHSLQTNGGKQMLLEHLFNDINLYLD